MGIKKGSQFEREIAKYLSKWISSGKSDAVFWRTDGSGARATTRAKQNKKTPNSYGDLCYIDEMGKSFIDYYLIEIKRGYGGTKRINSKKIIDILAKCNLLTTKEAIKEIRKLIAKGKGTNELDILNIIDNPKAKSTLIEWWEKAVKERILAGREEVLLIIKRDGKNPIIVFNHYHYSDPDNNCIKIDSSLFNLGIMDLDNFFNEFMPAKLWK